MGSLIAVLCVIAACVVIPTVLAFWVARTDYLMQGMGNFDDIILVRCEDCEGYGYFLMDGSVVPRELRKQGYYGPATEWTHTLSAITKMCLTCHGAGSYLTDRK